MTGPNENPGYFDSEVSHLWSVQGLTWMPEGQARKGIPPAEGAEWVCPGEWENCNMCREAEELRLLESASWRVRVGGGVERGRDWVWWREAWCQITSEYLSNKFERQLEGTDIFMLRGITSKFQLICINYQLFTYPSHFGLTKVLSNNYRWC